MAGNDIIDADAILAEQRAQAFRDIIGGSQGGYTPAYEPAPAHGPTVGDRASAFAKAVLGPGAKLAPSILGAVPGPVGDLAIASQGAEQADPGITRRAGQMALGLPEDKYAPPSATAGSNPGLESVIQNANTSYGPQNTEYPDIQAAPTLAQGAPAAQSYGVSNPGLGGSGGGLKGKWERAQQGQLDQIGLGADIQRTIGEDRAIRTDAVSGLETDNAARMQRDAEMQQQVDAAAAQKHQAFLDRNEQLADELGKMQVDPGRLLRGADASTQFTIGLGAVLGGINAAMNGGSNTSLDRLDKIIDRDIQSQIQDIDSKRASLGARSSLFGQMLAETGDRRLAAMQTRSLMYDAMKTKLKADSDRLGIPELRDNAEAAANEIDQKNATLKAQMSGDAYRTYLAQMQAAANAQRAAEERAWQRAKDVAEMNFKQQALNIEATKAGATKAGANKERDEAQVEVDANLRQLAADKRNIDKLDAASKVGKAWAEGAPGWAPGADAARDNVSAFKDYNVRAMMMVGAAYKLDTNANEPKNLELLKKYAEPYVFDEGDSKAVKLAKIQRLEELMVKSGAAKGTTVALPPGFTPDTKGKK